MPIPTEAQMKLAIAQTLSLPFAYNAPVIVLDFEASENGEVTGHFKDAGRPRVFAFSLDGESVSYKPYVAGRMDSFSEDVSDHDVKIWEDFSQGYFSRFDAGIKPRTGKPKCDETKSYSCGSACISLSKNCKKNPRDNISKERIQNLSNATKAYAKAIDKAPVLSDEALALEKKYSESKRKLNEAKAAKKQGIPRKAGEQPIKKSKDPVTADIIKRGGIKTTEQAKEVVDHLKQTFSGKGERKQGAADDLIEKFGIQNKQQADIMIGKLEKHLAS